MVAFNPADCDAGDGNLNHRKESIPIDNKVNVSYTYITNRLTGRELESAG